MVEDFLKEQFRNNVTNESLSTEIYKLLRDAIIKSEYNPGDTIVESKVAEALDVSRTPCRDAILILEREGFVKRIPNKGAL